MRQNIVLLSDSTGDLGERIIRALLSQFPPHSFAFRVMSFLTRNDLTKIGPTLDRDKPILFHTVVHEEFKKDIHNAAEKYHLSDYDLTGEALHFLEHVSGLPTHPNLELLHELNPEYDKRIAALSFTVGHDDGMGASSITKADILLTGVSRTSKTPTSIYLANKGFKVANIPIIKDIPLPELIQKNLKNRTIGLTIEAEKLQKIRLMRVQQEHIPGTRYFDLQKIREELLYAQNLYLEMRCPIIDVTHHAVEETAALILKTLRLR